jgi:serine/threonine-protein kinase HipA
MRGVSLTYGKEWLKGGFALSEDLPLIDIEHLPSKKDSAVGALDDARPDRWGEKVISVLEKPERSSVLEMLYFAGDERFGALGVSTSATHYLPRAGDLLPNFDDVEAVHEVVRKVISGESIQETQKRLIAPGGTMGGARPKALIEMDGSQWVLKFSEEDHSFEPALEHASMTLATKAGINAAETKLILLSKGCAVAVKRFDRSQVIGADGLNVDPATREHAISVGDRPKLTHLAQ